MKANTIIVEHFNDLAKYYASLYSEHSPGGYFLIQRLAEVCKLLDGYHDAKILDLGCGPGMMAEYCLKRGNEFFGVDISEAMIEECERKYAGVPSVHFSVGDLQNLDFQEHSFDVILCMGALEYIEESKIDNTIAEMARVLKPDGALIVSVLNEKSVYNRNRKIGWRVKALLRRAIGYGKTDGRPLDKNTRLFGEKSTYALLNTHNFDEINCSYFCINVFCPFIEHRFPKLSLRLIQIIERIVNSKFKKWRWSWAYRAFIISARRRLNELEHGNRMLQSH